MRHRPTKYPKKRVPLHARPRLGKVIVSVDVAVGSFSTEAAGSAARPTSALRRKLSSGRNVKLVATGQQQKSAVLFDDLVGRGEQYGVTPNAAAVFRLIARSNFS